MFLNFQETGTTASCKLRHLCCKVQRNNDAWLFASPKWTEACLISLGICRESNLTLSSKFPQKGHTYSLVGILRYCNDHIGLRPHSVGNTVGFEFYAVSAFSVKHSCVTCFKMFYVMWSLPPIASRLRPFVDHLCTTTHSELSQCKIGLPSRSSNGCNDFLQASPGNTWEQWYTGGQGTVADWRCVCIPLGDIMRKDSTQETGLAKFSRLFVDIADVDTAGVMRQQEYLPC
jgi:hypothetical protein